MNILKKIARIPARWIDPGCQDEYAVIYGHYRGVIVRYCPSFDESDPMRIGKWIPDPCQAEAVDEFLAREKMRCYNFYIALGKLDYDMIIVDTNIFMNAASRIARRSMSRVLEVRAMEERAMERVVESLCHGDSEEMDIGSWGINEDKLSLFDEDVTMPYGDIIMSCGQVMLYNGGKSDVEVWDYGENSIEENCRRCYEFFRAAKCLKLKIHILASQLNEISNMKRGDDSEKQFLARGAQKIIEKLQKLGLLDVLDDVVSNNQSYADPEILKVVKRNQKDGCKTLVITEDRDLRIRVTAISALAKSMNEIYHAGGFEATDFKDGVRSSISIRGVHCGGRFVCMNKDGCAELIANRTVADEWETFVLVMNPQGSWSLQSRANGKFVCVDLNQDGKLLARNETIDVSAEFELVPIGGKRPRFALKSQATNKYVSVCENQGNVVFANGPEIKDWEMLEFA